MNHGHQYISSPQHTHMSTGSSYAPHSQTAGMPHYPHYHPQTTGTYHQGASSYGYPYGSTSSTYSTGQPTSVSSSLLPFSLGTSAPHQHGYHSHSPFPSASHQPVHTFDTTGQIQPPNYAKPKMTATLWEDEGTLCFQVETKGVTVARREDNSYINGTKLLNVCGMTRGRRDGILKSEKNRNVVKIGPMHLKGVWIPYEKALEFANKEKITDILYPLFIHNIGQIITAHVNAQGEQIRSLDVNRFRARVKNNNNSSASNVNQIPSQNSGPSPLSTLTQTTGSRPSLERSHTFPTPPTSASSISGAHNNSSYDWNSQNMGSIVQTATPLAIDACSSNSRSLPNTPASTPPGNTIMPTYHTPSTVHQYSMPHGMSRYGQSNSYIKSEMGPPSKSSTSIGESDHTDIKQDPYAQSNSDHGDTSQDDNYPRGNYLSYNGIVENTITSSDQDSISTHQSTSGRGTPRTSVHSQQWTNGYSAPNRSGGAYNDTPTSTSHTGSPYSGTSYTTTSLGGSKRAREEDDSDYQSSRPMAGHDMESIKRRRGGTTDSSISSSTISGYDQNRLQSGSAILSSRLR